MHPIFRQFLYAGLLISALLVPSTPARAEGSSYIGEWRFEKNANDSSDAGNNGEAQRVRYTTGISGHSIRLGGSGSVTVPYNSSMDTANGVMIDLYFKVPDRGTTGTFVARGDLTQETGAWALGLVNGDLTFQYLGQDGSLQRISLDSGALEVDTWTHLIAVLSLPDGYIGFSTDFGSIWDYNLDVKSLAQTSDDLVIGQSFTGGLDEIEVSKPWG